MISRKLCNILKAALCHSFLCYLQLFLFSDLCRGYLVQLRQELGQRLIEKVFDPQTDKPSKVSTNSLPLPLQFNVTMKVLQ